MSNRTTINSKFIKASTETIYKAFTNPDALVVWFAPENMTAKIHNFELEVGKGYEMSLFYKNENDNQGKTSELEDKYNAKFVELVQNKKIVQVINFKSDNPEFLGEMIMEVVLEPESTGTKVTITFNNIPKGIKLEENEAGTESTLKNLAKYVES